MIAAPKGVQNPAYKFSHLFEIKEERRFPAFLRSFFFFTKDLHIISRDKIFYCFIFVNFARFVLQKSKNKSIM